jgi:Trypsin
MKLFKPFGCFSRPLSTLFHHHRRPHARNEIRDKTAHCQPGFLASLVAVFGEYDISGDLESKRSVTKNVKRVIVHRQYDAATFENDLAILELESPVRYDTHIGKRKCSQTTPV